MLPLWKMWTTSPVFVPAGWPLVLSPANSETERLHILPTHTSSLPSMFTPHGMLRAGPVKPIRANHIQRAREASRRPHHIAEHGVGEDLELLHNGSAVGKLRLRGLQVHVAHHPDIFLRVQGEGADTDPGPEALRLAGIVHREPHHCIRRRVGNPDAILRVDDDVEGRLQPRGFYDLA